MITECPSCNRQFRIHAWQLSAARGIVQCGYCSEQFNALDHLHDNPASSSVPQEASGDTREGIPDEPEFDIPDAMERKGSDEDDMTGLDKLLDDVEQAYDELKVAVEDDLETELDDLSRISTMQDGEDEGIAGDREFEDSDLDRDDLIFDPDYEGDEHDFSDISDEEALNEFGEVDEYEISEEEIPPELLDGEDRDSPVKGKKFWITGVVLLIILVTSQIIWFNRDHLLQRYPGFRPLISSFCERFACELIRGRDISAIVLINRDVRDHPRFSDSLLVNATIENQSGTLQPYPQIRLILFDTDGNITGYRTFRPNEYLDQSVDIPGGMPAGLPVHIVLEVAGAREAAVSFEFDFL